MNLQMKSLLVVAAPAALVLAAGAGYWAGARHASPPPVANKPEAVAGAKIDPASGKKVLYWHDPMVPGHRFDKPGKSPFMDMQLVPVYAEETSAAGGISISPAVRQNLGIRVAEVEKRALTHDVAAVGNVAWNERDVSLVQARAAGYVERLYARAPLDTVRKGQALADLVIPDWATAQEEFLAAAKVSPELAEAARQRMRLAGMTDEQIAAVAAGGKVQARITIRAPQSGVIAELSAREGMTLAAGTPLFRIQSLATVWVNAEIPEALAAQIRPGLPVQATAAALPGQRFSGKVAALLPEVNAGTRTLQARIELANPGGQLAPGMFANVSVRGPAAQPVLTVPSEAVIRTGERNVVFVATKDGFAPADVETGAEQQGRVEIRKGLQAGQKVVVSGQFLVDSEASLKGSVARMGADQ